MTEEQGWMKSFRLAQDKEMWCLVKYHCLALLKDWANWCQARLISISLQDSPQSTDHMSTLTELYVCNLVTSCITAARAWKTSWLGIIGLIKKFYPFPLGLAHEWKLMTRNTGLWRKQAGEQIDVICLDLSHFLIKQFFNYSFTDLFIFITLNPSPRWEPRGKDGMD